MTVINYPIYNNDELYVATKNLDQDILVFSEFIQELTCHDLLDSQMEIGIVAQVANKGTKNLSGRQSVVLSNIMIKFVKICKGCNSIIPLEEVVDSMFNGGFCTNHKYLVYKD